MKNILILLGGENRPHLLEVMQLISGLYIGVSITDLYNNWQFWLIALLQTALFVVAKRISRQECLLRISEHHSLKKEAQEEIQKRNSQRWGFIVGYMTLTFATMGLSLSLPPRQGVMFLFVSIVGLGYYSIVQHNWNVLVRRGKQKMAENLQG